MNDTVSPKPEKLSREIDKEIEKMFNDLAAWRRDLCGLYARPPNLNSALLSSKDLRRPKR
jgi:hypothetical protein